jgi:hypothetical protein
MWSIVSHTSYPCSCLKLFTVEILKKVVDEAKRRKPLSGALLCQIHLQGKGGNYCHGGLRHYYRTILHQTTPSWRGSNKACQDHPVPA